MSQVMEFELRIRGSVEDLHGILQLVSQEKSSAMPAGSFTWHEIPAPAPALKSESGKCEGICIRCHKSFTKHSNAQKNCDECKQAAKDETRKRCYDSKKARQLKEKLDHIRETCPAPQPRPNIHRQIEG